MITISSIPHGYFKSSFINCKNDIKWFYGTLIKSRGKFIYYILKNDNTEIGTLVNYSSISKHEFGICIFDEFKYKGIGSKVIKQLIENIDQNAIFTINKRNSVSINFFKKLIKSRVIYENNINII